MRLPAASGSGSLPRLTKGGSPNPVGGGPAGDGRRANPTRAAARPCVGGASRRFRLRQSAPVDEGRQSQPRGRWPGGRRAAVPTPWATAPAGGGRRANPTPAAARPCVGEASRRFRLRQSGPVDEGRQSQPRGRWPGGRQAAVPTPWATAPAGGGRRANPTQAVATAPRGKGFPPLPAPPAGSGGRGRRAGPARERLPAASGSGGRTRRAEEPQSQPYTGRRPRLCGAKSFPLLPAPAAGPGGRRSDSPSPARGGGPALCRKGLSVASGSGSLARLRPS